MISRKRRILVFDNDPPIGLQEALEEEFETIKIVSDKSTKSIRYLTRCYFLEPGNLSTDEILKTYDDVIIIDPLSEFGKVNGLDIVRYLDVEARSGGLYPYVFGYGSSTQFSTVQIMINSGVLGYYLKTDVCPKKLVETLMRRWLRPCVSSTEFYSEYL